MQKSNILKSLTALTLVFGLAACVDPNPSTGGNSSNPSEQLTPSDSVSPSLQLRKKSTIH